MKKKNNSDFIIEKNFAFSLQGRIYQRTKIDDNKIYERKWFQRNIGRKLERVDIMREFESRDKNSFKTITKITNKETWNGCTVSEILYRMQFDWDYRYKLRRKTLKKNN